MSKRKHEAAPGADEIGAGTAVEQEEVVAEVVEPTAEVEVPAATQPPVPETYDLMNHPDYVLQAGVGRLVIYRGDKLDLLKLRPSQFQRLTTNADAANIVRKR